MEECSLRFEIIINVFWGIITRHFPLIWCNGETHATSVILSHVIKHGVFVSVGFIQGENTGPHCYSLLMSCNSAKSFIHSFIRFLLLFGCCCWWWWWWVCLLLLLLFVLFLFFCFFIFLYKPRFKNSLFF